MPVAFEVPAEGQVDVIDFYVQVPFKEDVYVKALEVRPGAPSLVHHAGLYVIDKLPADAKLVDGRVIGSDGQPMSRRDIARANGRSALQLPTVTHPEGTPVTANDPALAQRLNATIANALGSGNVVPFVQQGMGGEDFAYFVESRHGVKGYYFAVGGTPQAAFDAAQAGGPAVPSHHSPLFKVTPVAAIVTGAIAMTAAVLDLLGPAGSATGQ